MSLISLRIRLTGRRVDVGVGAGSVRSSKMMHEE